MNSNNPMRNYKHDICGKFRDITTAIDSLGENAFEDPQANEIFHAVHELLLKMVRTSRNLIEQNLKQEIVLVVSDRVPDTNLPTLQIEGFTVRHLLSPDRVQYFIYESENMNFNGEMAPIRSLLPFTDVVFEKVGEQ